MQRFLAQDTEISGVRLIERRPLKDGRGSLTRLFCSHELAEVGWTKPIAQINHTLTIMTGTLRGMHFQRSPSSEMKLIMCLRGEIFDVAVDLRHGSPTLFRQANAILSADNMRAFLIPEGCAHGFQALTDDVEILYLHSAAYDASAEEGVHPQDESLGIKWPLPVSLISDRDSTHPRLGDTFMGIDP